MLYKYANPYFFSKLSLSKFKVNIGVYRIIKSKNQSKAYLQGGPLRDALYIEFLGIACP